MRPPRFKIRTLLGVVAFVAIAVAALRAADDAWDSGVLGLTLLILLAAVPLANYRTDRRRAFWLGFALFGWAYVVTSLIPQIGPRLPTTLGLAFIDSKIPGREATISAVFAYTSTYSPVQGYQGYVLRPQVNTPTSYPNDGAWIWDLTTGKWVPGPGSTTENFIRIGHSLLALLLAFCGGHLSRYLYDQRQGASVLSPGDSSVST